MPDRLQDDARDTCEIVRRRLADGRTIADADVHELVLEIIRLRAENERLREAAVKAVMPLEVIRMSGWERHLADETRQIVGNGIAAVRAALSPQPKTTDTRDGAGPTA